MDQNLLNLCQLRQFGVLVCPRQRLVEQSADLYAAKAGEGAGEGAGEQLSENP